MGLSYKTKQCSGYSLVEDEPNEFDCIYDNASDKNYLIAKYKCQVSSVSQIVFQVAEALFELLYLFLEMALVVAIVKNQNGEHD